MLNDFTRIAAAAAAVLLAGGLALGTTHPPAAATHRPPATAGKPGTASSASADSFWSGPLIGSSASSTSLAQETRRAGTFVRVETRRGESHEPRSFCDATDSPETALEETTAPARRCG